MVRHRGTYTLFVLVTLAATPATASPARSAPTPQPNPYRCQMHWERLTDGKLKKEFPLSNGVATIPTYPNERVEVSGDKGKSAVKVYQLYGDKNENHILYEIECKPANVCLGARVTLANGKKNKEPFSFAPTVPLIAKIGEREIFHFTPEKNGFRYRFLQYVSKDHRFQGMELGCHE